MTSTNKAGLLFYLLGLNGFFSGNPEADILYLFVEFVGAVLFMQKWW